MNFLEMVNLYNDLDKQKTNLAKKLLENHDEDEFKKCYEELKATIRMMEKLKNAKVEQVL